MPVTRKQVRKRSDDLKNQKEKGVGSDNGSDALADDEKENGPARKHAKPLMNKSATRNSDEEEKPLRRSGQKAPGNTREPRDSVGFTRYFPIEAHPRFLLNPAARTPARRYMTTREPRDSLELPRLLHLRRGFLEPNPRLFSRRLQVEENKVKVILKNFKQEYSDDEPEMSFAAKTTRQIFDEYVKHYIVPSKLAKLLEDPATLAEELNIKSVDWKFEPPIDLRGFRTSLYKWVFGSYGPAKLVEQNQQIANLNEKIQEYERNLKRLKEEKKHLKEENKHLKAAFIFVVVILIAAYMFAFFYP